MTTAGHDLDAYRRHKNEHPREQAHVLLRALDAMTASEDPHVTFARLVENCTPHFADGCAIDLGDGNEPTCRLRATSCRKPVTGRRSLHTQFSGAPRGHFARYAGVFSAWWSDRDPSESDVLTAALLLRYTIALIDAERLTVLLGKSDERSSRLAIEAITTRPINLATGLLMATNGCDDREAENTLRAIATDTSRNLYEASRDLLESAQVPVREQHANGACQRIAKAPPLRQP